MRQLERRIERLILHFLNDMGLEPWKNEQVGHYDTKQRRFKSMSEKHGVFSAKGSPDILCILPGGRLCGIEVKSPDGRLTRDQTAFITRINRRGGVSFVSRGIQQTFEQIKPFWPGIVEFEHILRKYLQLEKDK